MKNKYLFVTALMMASSATMFAQEQAQKDSIPNTKEVKNRNVMLNASSDNQPRQISIGLPSEMSATIYEDGTPVSWTWWPLLPYFYWASSPMYSKVGLTSLSENAITNGSVNYSVDSWSREGGDKFEGHADYTTNSYGLQRFDASIAGPIKNGWNYALSAYVNHDPGTNKLADAAIQNDMKQVKATVTKHFNNNKGKISLNYKYSMYKGMGDGTGPFIYVGDGSVKEYEGFNLGKDGYLPANSQLSYMDVVDGKMKYLLRNKDNHALSQDVNLNFEYNFRPDLHFTFLSKYHYADTYYASLSSAGIGEATATSGYTYAYDTEGHSAGDVFTGKYNTRYLMRIVGSERAWYNTAELKGTTHNKKHNWRVGANAWWILPEDVQSTGIYAHTVEKDPVWLELGGNQGIVFNTGGNYYDTHEIKTGIYASDDWQATDRLWLSAGVRLEYYKVQGWNAAAKKGAYDTEIAYPENVRNAGFNLTQMTKTKIDEGWFNPAAAINARYTIAHGFGVLAEGIFTKSAPGSPNFASDELPNVDPIYTYFAKGGLFWNTPWMKLVSQVSLIKKTNYQRGAQFTNPNDASDICNMLTTYDIQTLGWTTDVVLTPFKGFSFHGLLTLQSPKYKNYALTANFADGSSLTYDFNDKITTGVSKVLIELDPSYMFSKFRVWASFRYFSKQYINKTNSLYFNGRWETFAGVDYNLNKHVSFGLNFVNLFNQKGASGSISSADLVTDTSAYKNYLMCGSYIRPFTVELATHINF